MMSKALRSMKAHPWRLVAMSCAVGMLAFWLVLEFSPWSHRLTLARDSLQVNAGCAYTTRLPISQANPFVEMPSDSTANPQASKLRLYEGGEALGPSHASHEQIRQSGRGAFSHWGDFL